MPLFHTTDRALLRRHGANRGNTDEPPSNLALPPPRFFTAPRRPRA